MAPAKPSASDTYVIVTRTKSAPLRSALSQEDVVER